MDLVYFDQNIWSRLKDIKKSNPELYNDFLIHIKSRNFQVIFSIVNIRETLRIPENFNEDKDLLFSIISEITNNTLINEQGETIFCKPQFLLKKINDDNILRKELYKSIENLIPTPSKSLAEHDIGNYNNLETENAFITIIKNTFSDVSINSNIDFSIGKKIIHNLFQEIYLQMEKRYPCNNEIETIKEIFSILELFLINQLKINSIKFAEAINSKDYDSIYNLIISSFPTMPDKIASIQAISSSLGYNRDTMRIMKRKNSYVDMDDYEHSKFFAYCKWFVTEDKHLMKRLMISKSELNLENYVLTFEDFKNIITEPD